MIFFFVVGSAFKLSAKGFSPKIGNGKSLIEVLYPHAVTELTGTSSKSWTAYLFTKDNEIF